MYMLVAQEYVVAIQGLAYNCGMAIFLSPNIHYLFNDSSGL